MNTPAVIDIGNRKAVNEHVLPFLFRHKARGVLAAPYISCAGRVAKGHSWGDIVAVHFSQSCVSPWWPTSFLR
jgi:hypothetical protein